MQIWWPCRQRDRGGAPAFPTKRENACMPEQDQPIRVREEREGAVALLTLDHPGRRNALSPPLKQQLEAALERVLADREVRAVVLTGAGGHFSAGGDLGAMDATDLAAGRARMEAMHRLVRLMVRSPKPLLAAVEGWCAGGSVGLMLCCDTIIAAAGARFVASFPKVGLVPDLGLMHSLPRRLGEGRARQMLLYAEPVAAPEALRIGLVDQMVADGGTVAAALARAARLCELAPLSLSYTRQRLWHGLEDVLDWERDTQAALFLSADHAEGRAAFFGKRDARFENR